MSQEEKNVVGAAIAAAAAMAQNLPKSVILVPDGYKKVDIESHMEIPLRKRGVVAIHTVGSFVQYVNRHKSTATQIYAQMSPPKFVAVIDDHFSFAENDVPNFGEHRAVYEAPLSVEWKTWNAFTGKPMTQEEFALFLEQNVLDIMDPAAGAMLDIARTLQATSGAKFKSGTNLSNGSVAISYEEEVNGTAGIEGKTTIPEEFKLAIPVLQGGPRFQVVAKFRYKIAGGVLKLSYDLIRPHKVLEASVDEIVKAIEATDSPVAPAPGVDDLGGPVQAPTPDAGTGINVLYGVPRQ